MRAESAELGSDFRSCCLCLLVTLLPLRTFHFFTPQFFYRCQKSIKWDGDPHLVGEWRGVKRGQYLAQLWAQSYSAISCSNYYQLLQFIEKELTRKQAGQRSLGLAVAARVSERMGEEARRLAEGHWSSLGIYHVLPAREQQDGWGKGEREWTNRRRCKGCLRWKGIIHLSGVLYLFRESWGCWWLVIEIGTKCPWLTNDSGSHYAIPNPFFFFHFLATVPWRKPAFWCSFLRSKTIQMFFCLSFCFLIQISLPLSKGWWLKIHCLFYFSASSYWHRL